MGFKLSKDSSTPLLFAWLPALIFINNHEPSQSILLLCVALGFIALTFIWNTRRAPLYFIPLMPLIPIFSGDLLGLKFEDILAAVVFLCLLISVTNNVKVALKGVFPIFLVLSLLFVTISFLLAGATLYKGFFNFTFTMLWLLYGYRIGLDSRVDGISIRSIVQAGLVSGVVMFSALVSGINLNDLMSEPEQIGQAELNSAFLFRGTYFYTNIFYIFGAAFIFTTFLYRQIGASKFSSILLQAATLFFLVTYLNKTALLAAGIVLITALVMSRRVTKAHVLGVFSLYLILSLGFSFILQRFPETARFLNWSSMYERGGVLLTFIDQVQYDTYRLLFGYGPESLTRVNEDALLRFKSSFSGVEGTVDSAYLSIAIESGPVVLMLFLGLVGHILWKLYLKSERLRSVGISRALFFVILYFAICATTQVIGYSKVGWLVFFLMGLSMGVSVRGGARVSGTGGIGDGNPRISGGGITGPVRRVVRW